MTRLENYLKSIGEFNSEFEEQVVKGVKSVRKEVLSALKKGMKEKKPRVSSLFENVYKDEC